MFVKRIFGSLFVLGLWACQSAPVSITHLPCPCTAEYVCCESLNQCLSPGEMCPDPLKVAKYTQAYTSADGMKVFVVPVEPADAKQALIQVTGINHDWDGKVFLHDVRSSSSGSDYFRQVAGREYVELISRKDLKDQLQYYIFIQGLAADEIALTYSESLSTATNPQDILARYFQQGGNKDASLPPPYDKFYAKEEASLKEEADLTNEKCGSNFTIKIDWSTFTSFDVRTDDHSPSGYCSAPFEALRYICDASDTGAADKVKVQNAVKKFVCAWGGEGKRAIDLADGTLNYHIDFTSYNDADFAQEYLEKHL